MKKCNSCNIDFITSSNLCPICRNNLYGDNEISTFPTNILYNTSNLILKIVLFISISILIIYGFIEINIFKEFKYINLVFLGLLTNYTITYFILKNSKNILKMFFKYGIVLMFLTIIWYIFTKKSYIPNYIIPGISLLEIVSNFIINLIFRKNYFIRYSNLLLTNIILLIMPALFILLNITTNNLMSYICLIIALITILGLIIFCFDDLIDELKKIFNI